MRKFIIMLSLFLIYFTLPAFAAADNVPSGILYTQPLESVIFSHQDHVQKDFSCLTCHSGLFEMEAFHVQKKKDFNMKSLYKGKYCGACHNGKKAFAANTQCARCHVGVGARATQKDIPSYKSSVILGKGVKGVTFNHENHIQKASCRSCHSSLFKPGEGADKIAMVDHSRGKFCFACHDQKGLKAFSWNDCARCHRGIISGPTEAVKFGEGVKAVSFRHETHQLKAGCQACHPKLFAFQKSVAKIDFDDHLNRQACFTCHAKKNGTASYDCNRCHKDKPAVKPGMSYPDTLKYETKMQNVYFHHESHAIFSCMICHGGMFAMKKGQTEMKMSDMLHGKTCGSCHDGQKAFNVRECARCHKK
ncbi:MAG: c(7)-type cytochrome triheme domain-containing protein [Smithella sp.]